MVYRSAHTVNYLAHAGARLGVVALLLGLLALCGGCSLRSSAPGMEESATASGNAVCSTARAQLGTPYKYGGTTPETGFDCSGLVSWAYARHGLATPRTAREQNGMGNKVGRNGLRAGDVVVFRTKSGMHTGIYTGKGRFVHSPGTGKLVREDDIDSKYWSPRFVAGRRHRGLY